MKAKVLLINQTFYPDNAATSQVLTDLAGELVKRGHEVTALADVRSYDDRRKILPRKELYDEIRIHRIGSTSLGKKTRFHRGLDYLTFTLALIWKVFLLPRYDVVIGLTTPPWISFFSLIICRLKGGKFIHWAMDVNPDEAVRLGWVRENSMFFRLLNSWTRFTYRKANRIIALDNYMAALIQQKSVGDHKVYIISPWAHDEIESVDHKDNPFREKHSLVGKFVVMYAGNFSICHPVDTLLKAAYALRDQKDIVFVFIGDGMRLNEIITYKSMHTLDNIMHLPYQNRKDIKYSLSAADLHVVIMGEQFVGIIHPCKIYGILGTGRAFVLIGPKRCHVGDIITENKIGFQVDHGDVRGLVSLIRQSKTMSEREKRDFKRRSMLLARNKFSKDILCRKIIDNCINLHH